MRCADASPMDHLVQKMIERLVAYFADTDARLVIKYRYDGERFVACGFWLLARDPEGGSITRI